VKIHELRRTVQLPAALSQVFPFFADPRNLEALTPPWLKFQILTPTAQMVVGQRIDYKLRLHGLPIRWQSEITLWEPPHRFVDEQRTGPYRMWIHEHIFREEGGFTYAEDNVRYAVRGGSLVNRLFIRGELERIFAYRAAKLIDVFGGGTLLPESDT